MDVSIYYTKGKKLPSGSKWSEKNHEHTSAKYWWSGTSTIRSNLLRGEVVLMVLQLVKNVHLLQGL